MSLLALLIALAAFVVVLRVTGAEAAVTQSLATSRNAAAVIRAGDIDEDEKERRVRRAAGQLFGSFLRIAASAAASLIVPAAIVWAGAALGLWSIDRVVAIATGWPFLIGGSVAAVALWIGLNRMGRARR